MLNAPMTAGTIQRTMCRGRPRRPRDTESMSMLEFVSSGAGLFSGGGFPRDGIRVFFCLTFQGLRLKADPLVNKTKNKLEPKWFDLAFPRSPDRGSPRTPCNCRTICVHPVQCAATVPSRQIPGSHWEHMGGERHDWRFLVRRPGAPPNTYWQLSLWEK